MKTSIKTLVATGLMALAISTSTVYANDVINPTVSVRDVNVSSIKRLIISGDVEVTIAQTPKSKVLFTNEGNADVSVKKVGNALYVSSKGNSLGAKVTIFVDDLYRIEASGNVVVENRGLLTLKYLQVFLKDNAKVELNSKTESLYTTIQDTAELTLKGMTDSYKIQMDKSSKITLDKFVSKTTDMSSSAVYVASRR
jgi:hypothetical protein